MKYENVIHIDIPVGRDIIEMHNFICPSTRKSFFVRVDPLVHRILNRNRIS